jgi:hypothetical protein
MRSAAGIHQRRIATGRRRLGRRESMFLGAVGARPVYNLLGKKDLGTSEFPPMETALIDGDIAFRQHSGGHTAGPNWPTFLKFASRYIKGPPLATVSRVDGHLLHEYNQSIRGSF